MILVIEDNKTWQKIYSRLLPQHDLVFCRDDIRAIQLIDQKTPQLILLDIFLNGPTAFTLLNELQSYPELANIPIIIVSDADLSRHNLKPYNIVKIFDKASLDPRDLQREVEYYV